MSELATGAIGAVASILSLIYGTVQIIDTIRQEPEFLRPIRRQLVKLSQRLSRLQHASLNKTFFERLAWTPYNDSKLIALEKDVEIIRRLASRYRWDKARSSRASLAPDKDTVERLRKHFDSYSNLLKQWDLENSISDRSLLTPNDKQYITPSDRTPAGLLEDDRFRVLQWLSSIDHRVRHRDLQSNQDHSIGEDFIQRHFQRWRQTSTSNLLWVHGRPGSGKTYLASRVIDNISSDTHSNNLRLAYAYCDVRHHYTLADIAASLVKQLLAANNHLPQLALDIFKERHAQENPSLSDLLRIYLEAAPLSHRVNVVIDAFDAIQECSHHEMLAVIRVLEHSNTKIVIFSRNRIPPNIRDKASIRLSEVELVPPANDIFHALKNRLVVTRFPEVPEELSTGLTRLAERADGSFVAPLCHLMEVSNRCLTSADILRELQPTKVKLDNSLSRVINNVCKQHDMKYRKLAIHTLKWLCQSKRPLSAREICEAYAIDDSQAVLSNVNVPKPDSIEQSCQGLVVIDSFNTVNVAYSALWLPLLDKMRQESLLDPVLATQDCLRYLQVAGAAQTAQSSIQESAHPFLAYAEANWMLHLQDYHALPLKEQKYRSKILSLAIGVLQRPVFRNLGSLSPTSETRSWHGMTASLNDTRDVSSLHICARFDLVDEARQILQNTSLDHMKEDVTTSNSTTPLHEAARTNSQNVARLLLASSKVDLKKSDTDGRSALHYATYYGQIHFIEAFRIFPWDIDHQDTERKSSLMLAAQLGHHEILRTLLDEGASIDLSDQRGNTALHFACLNGQYDVAQILLARGASVSKLNSEGFTPLHSAVLGRSAELVRLLLLLGGSPKSKALDGSTPLHLAAAKAEALIVTRLLAQGAEVDAIDQLNRTPAYMAACWDNEDALRALIDHGANIDYVGKTKVSEKAISTAQGSYNQLLGTGQLMSAIPYSASPLMVAALQGYTHIVKMLLNFGADPNNKNVDGESAMLFAVTSGHSDIVKMLLRYGADINVLSNEGISPLQAASRSRQQDMVQLLEENGADPSSLDNIEGHTPLMRLEVTSYHDMRNAYALGGTGLQFQTDQRPPNIEIYADSLSGSESIASNWGMVKHRNKRLRITTGV